MTTLIYTFAKKDRVVAGHGVFFEETKIVRTGAYGTGEFPPCFVSITEARKKCPSGYIVVTLELLQ